MEPTRITATISLYSPKQQAVVDYEKGCATFIDVKPNCSVNTGILGEGRQALFDGLTKEAEKAKEFTAKGLGHTETTRS